MARRRKYYIPITRSGSSILASLITQWIRQPREPYKPSPQAPDARLGCLVLAITLCIVIFLFYACYKLF